MDTGLGKAETLSGTWINNIYDHLQRYLLILVKFPKPSIVIIDVYMKVAPSYFF